MFVRAVALIALLMLPAVALHFAVDAQLARYLALGTVFAFLMGVSSRRSHPSPCWCHCSTPRPP
jgi:hypothetical protein